jgi:hypothetical protein
MLYLFHARLEKPAEMTRQDFYKLWLSEVEAAIQLAGPDKGKGAFKFSGFDEFVAIFDFASHEEIDQFFQALPIFKQNHQDIIKDVQLRPVRELGSWLEHLRVLASASDT